MEYSQNTIWLMEWCDRMLKKYGHPETGVDWCRKLAYFMDESGNDSPSDDAIKTAKTWEKEQPGD